MDILIGILTLLLGLAVATMGLRLWFWMLPILGFMVGFSLGTILVYQLAGDGILETVLSWIVGFIAGVAFALASWLWWYLGVIIAAGTAGAALATALAASFGAEANWLLLIIAITGAAVFSIAALLLRLPIYLVIVNTAIAGGLAVVTGLLLIFDRLDLRFLGSGYAFAIIDNSPGWWLLWAIVAGVGIYLQLRETAVVGLPDDRFVPASHAIRR
ncbi:MAG TPA: DUF4203 domain-containing protein [Thermomicrobiales bacterium]|nr:DUF4203 domain-containing protein [Thermomicrobiales bacterium]